MGLQQFKQESTSIHKAGYVLAVIRIVFAIVLIGYYSSLVSLSNDLIGSFGGSNQQKTNAGNSSLIIVGSIALIIIDSLWLLGYLTWNRGIHITCIVLTSVALVYVGVIAIVFLLGYELVEGSCSIIIADCTQCPDYLSDYQCNIDSCWYRNSFKTVCPKFVSHVHFVAIWMFLLSTLQFIGAIIGCVGSMASRYQPVLVVPTQPSVVPVYQSGYAQQPQQYGNPYAPQPQGYPQPQVYQGYPTQPQ